MAMQTASAKVVLTDETTTNISSDETAAEPLILRRRGITAVTTSSSPSPSWGSIRRSFGYLVVPAVIFVVWQLASTPYYYTTQVTTITVMKSNHSSHPSNYVPSRNSDGASIKSEYEQGILPLSTQIKTKGPSSLSTTTSNSETRHVITWQGLNEMDAMVDSIWGGNLVCETIQQARNRTLANGSLLPESHAHRPVTLNISFGCEELFTESITGSGNFILVVYMMRSTAVILGNLHIHFTCVDAQETRHSLLLPWFTGSWYTHSAVATIDMSAVQRKQAQLLLKEACCPFWCTSISRMQLSMEYDMRRMAIALVGVQPSHPSTDWNEAFLRSHTDDTTTTLVDANSFTLNVSTPTTSSATWKPQVHIETTSDIPRPIFPDVALDDAVIHFRCGDLFLTVLESYGFMTFEGYTRHISPDARTIGILTQPFGNTDATTNEQLRILDQGEITRYRCKTLVLALQDYIVKKHPQAKVRVRNDPNETIALTYARIVMANQSVGAMTTFSVFPLVASFGTGYFLRPSKWTPSVWLVEYVRDLVTTTANKVAPKIVLFDELNLLLGSKAKDLWDKSGEAAVLAWFRNTSAPKSL